MRKNKTFKKAVSYVLAGAMILTSVGFTGTQADAASSVKLNKTKATLAKKGKKVTLKVTAASSKIKIKSTTWKAPSKKIATVTSKGVVKAVWAGDVKKVTNIKCTVKFTKGSKKKVYKKVLKCKVTVKAQATDTPSTNTPATDTPATDTPTTETPATDTPSTDTPSTDTPNTDTPTTGAPNTDAPNTESPAPEDSTSPSPSSDSSETVETPPAATASSSAAPVDASDSTKIDFTKAHVKEVTDKTVKFTALKPVGGQTLEVGCSATKGTAPAKTDWKKINEKGEVTISGLTAEKTYYFYARKAGDDTSKVGGWDVTTLASNTEVIKLPAFVATGAAWDVTEATITLAKNNITTVSGGAISSDAEVAITKITPSEADGGAAKAKVIGTDDREWVSPSNGKYVFSGLKSDYTYTFVARVKATSTKTYSVDSNTVDVTTLAAKVTAYNLKAVAPVLTKNMAAVSGSSITFTGIPSVTGGSVQVGVIEGSSSSVSKWVDVTSGTARVVGLTPSTTYKFVTRVKPTDSSVTASEPDVTKALSLTTVKASFGTITLSPDVLITLTTGTSIAAGADLSSYLTGHKLTVLDETGSYAVEGYTVVLSGSAVKAGARKTIDVAIKKAGYNDGTITSGKFELWAKLAPLTDATKVPSLVKSGEPGMTTILAVTGSAVGIVTMDKLQYCVVESNESTPTTSDTRWKDLEENGAYGDTGKYRCTVRCNLNAKIYFRLKGDAYYAPSDAFTTYRTVTSDVYGA